MISTADQGDEFHTNRNGRPTDCAQYPAKEVAELEQEILQVQEALQEHGVEHPGKSAEQAYEKMLSQLSLTEGEVQDGKTVVGALLTRCLLWIEIVKEKYVFNSVWLLELH